MALEKVSQIGNVGVLPSGHIEVRMDNKIMEDGVEVAKLQPHRHVLNPGDDLTNQDPVVQAVATAVWTPEVIAAYRATQVPLEPEPTEAPE